MRLQPLATAVVLALASMAVLPPAHAAAARASKADDRDLPVRLTANSVRSTADQETVAEGEAELRRGGLLLTADLLRYLDPTQLVIAEGHVKLRSVMDSYETRWLQIRLDNKQGYALDPSYHFGRTGAGGQAQRLDFLGPQQVRATQANYSSCTRTDGEEPGWELRMDRLDLDFDTNEGRAEGAVLRFLGVPILAFPVLSFPASDEPKTGWLPPTIDPFDSSNGSSVAMPFYWRIAPNLDTTITPMLSSRRGAGALGQFRYLTEDHSGTIDVHTLPDDHIAGRSRYSAHVEQEGVIGGSGLRYVGSYQQASDDTYWKDFSRYLPSLTRRLLPQDLRQSRQFDLASGGMTGEVETYARAQGWRTLQDVDNPIETPYQREPQLGLRARMDGAWGLNYELEAEGNRFTLRDRAAGDTRPQGSRVHLQTAISLPNDAGWGWLTPRLAVNAASYQTDTPMADGRTRASRTIPTFSLDGGLRFQRELSWFDSAFTQTLEPRLHYVNTPPRGQTNLPLFDTAASDFNAVSIYADNGFTGVDRIADAHQLTTGATTRFIDGKSGIERLRFGVAQRFLFRDQQLTPDGTPGTTRASDLLLFASGTLTPAWRMDTTVQYNQNVSSAVRTIASLRYSPGPYQTISGTYRYARSLSEQFELGYQWPLFRPKAMSSSGTCQGALYGVGRANYSLKDRRMTDAIFGLEYDAGCWVARIVNERTSTGQTETSRRTMIQLELIGLSRLGSNPLQVLKDNIPGYRLLRDDTPAPLSTVNP